MDEEDKQRYRELSIEIGNALIELGSETMAEKVYEHTRLAHQMALEDTPEGVVSRDGMGDVVSEAWEELGFPTVNRMIMLDYSLMLMRVAFNVIREAYTFDEAMWYFNSFTSAIKESDEGKANQEINRIIGQEDRMSDSHFSDEVCCVCGGKPHIGGQFEGETEVRVFCLEHCPDELKKFLPLVQAVKEKMAEVRQDDDA